MGNDNVTVEKVDITGVRELIQAHMRDTGVSQALVARQSGVGGSTLSQFLTGDYQGRQDTVAVKLSRYLQRRRTSDHARALMPVAPEWVQTPTSQKIWEGVVYCHNYGDLGIVFGGAGFGKTRTLEHYALTNPRVWIITASPALNTVSALMDAAAMAVGFRNLRMSAARLQREVIATIKGTGGLLVVDEAQHLEKEPLEQLRSIHDVARVGLVLAGNAEIYKRIYGNSGNGFAQLFSRVAYRVPLVKPLPGDVKAIAGIYGIDDDDTLAFLEQVAAKPGALRMVVKVCRLATALSPEGVDRTAVQAAYEQLQPAELDLLERAA